MSKNIMCALDGTGNEFGKNVTNVVKAYECAVKSDSQLCFYNPGIGTGGWSYEEESGLLRAKSDQATGYGLQRNVEQAYEFLMATYEEGDKVFLFGFSRGGRSRHGRSLACSTGSGYCKRTTTT